jgi:hypothetical protein
LTAFGGRPGFDYILADGAAGYGTLDPGTARSCQVQADCYLLAAAVPDGEERPLGHVDAVAEESAGPAREIWRLHLSGSFLDLAGEPAGRAIEQLVHAHATAGCAADRYCPSDALTRRQLALLVEQAAGGEFPLPFLATGTVFADVPAGDPFAEWIERFSADGAGGGCTSDPDGGGPLLPRFCPQAPVRRDQLARAVVRLRFGAAFVPPVCESRPFADVLPADPSCPWILAARQQGVPGCTDDPDGNGPLLARFCPESTATRAQAAVALARGFALTNWSLGL